MLVIWNNFKTVIKIDYKKILLFGFLSFIILMNYALLKALKDSFVVKNMGAEAIGFLKFYFLLPSTILFLLLYTKFSNSFSQNNIFIGICLIFLVLFLFLFYSIFFKYKIFTKEEILFFEEYTPRFKWFIRIALNWQYSLLYILAELWGAIIYTFFFFQLSNSVFSEQEAKARYPFIIFLGNLSLPFAGFLINLIKGKPQSVLILVVCINILTIWLYWFVSKSFKALPIKKKVKKLQGSLLQSLKFILSSKKLWLLFIMIVSLGMSLNVVEVFWKGKLGKLSGSVEEYMQNIGNIQSIQGWISLIFVIGSMLMFSNFSWKISSLFVALLLFFVGVLFFCVIFVETKIQTIMLLGIVHTIIGKCLKYSFFDPSKEFVYISLDQDSKTKGKATVDILGGRFGKSGLGVLESILFFIFPMRNFDNTTLFFAIIFFFISLSWVKAIFVLDKQLKIK